MNTALIASVILAVYIMTACIVNRSIPESISQLVKDLTTAGVWLWSTVMILTAVLTLPAALDAACENTQFLAFISCAALVFMAVTPLVNNTSHISYTVHMASAYTSAAASQLLVLLNCPWLLMLWVPFFIFWYVFSQRRSFPWKFWSETTCFVITLIFSTLF